MDPHHSAVDRILSRPSQVRTGGDKPLKDRKVAGRWKKLLQTGLLSTMLLVQAVQGLQAGPLIQNLLDHHSQGPVATQVENIQASRASVEIGGAELVNPLEGRGLDHVLLNNGIEGTEILSQWKESNIDPVDVFELTKTLMLTQSPTFVRDAEAKQQVLDLAARTQGIFDLKTPEEARQFLEQNNTVKLFEEGLLSSSEVGGLAFSPGGEAHYGHSDDLWFSMASVGRGLDTSNIWVESGQTAQDFQNSIENLQNAVNETGLKTLKVPVPMWASSQTLDTLADQLVQANLEMQQVTGWQGEVLGLKGNVSMLAGEGFGQAQASNEEGHGLWVAGSVNAMDHEVLIHGVDFLLAEQSGYKPVNGELNTLGAAWEAGHRQDLTDPAKTWLELENGVVSDMSEWREGLTQALETGSKEWLTQSHHDYFLLSHETLAATFEVTNYHVLGADSALTYKGDLQRPGRPSVEQASPTIERFQKAFDTLNETWWSQMPDARASLDISSISQHAADAGSISDIAPQAIPAPEIVIPTLGAWRQSRGAGQGSQEPGPALSSPKAFTR